MKKYIYIFVLMSFFENTFGQTITGYEYWFDNDYANKVTVSVANLAVLNINTQINTTQLGAGIHIFNFRSKQSNGSWSPVNTQFFHKPHGGQTGVISKITSYEYWFDNDFDNAVKTTITNEENFNLNTVLSTNGLSNGIHVVNMRFKDNKGATSNAITQFIYKVPQITAPTPNHITAYRYWLNDDFTNVKIKTLTTPVQDFILLDNIDLTQIHKGIYVINFQFRDQLGKWSPVSSNTIEKIALPLAQFSFTKTTSCVSTTYTFSNESIDGDTYVWDFGDGTQTTTQHPTHTYNAAGSYQVSLVATNIATGKVNTKTINISVIGHTTSNLEIASCGPYTSPSGLYTWTNTGIYKDTLVNSYGCDSVITVNLTVNPIIIPGAPTAISNYRCGPGNVSLSAAGCTGSYNWFSSATSTEVLATTSTFNTPNLSSTTSYYVSCNIGACLSSKIEAIATVHINIVQPAGALAPGVYSSSASIISRATVGSPTNFKSGGFITLEPGFFANAGTVFKAEIGPCQ